MDRELPEKTKYFFSRREVLNFGTFTRISDHFNVEDANDWRLTSAFWAYPKEYPGTVVNKTITFLLYILGFLICLSYGYSLLDYGNFLFKLFQPISVASSSVLGFHHSKLTMGIEANRKDNIVGDNIDQLKDGHDFTFWAYDHNYTGTKEYHVFYTHDNFLGVLNDTQRFTLSPIKTIEGKDHNGWNLKTTFWAFEDDHVKQFTGNRLYIKMKTNCLY